MDAQEKMPRLPGAHAEGNREALDTLLPLLYEELRRMAWVRLCGEQRGHLLEPASLVHEAYLKLAALERMRWRSRPHFLALASRAMRNVLVDHAVRGKAEKRGGGQPHVPLDGLELEAEAPGEEGLALEEALARLATHDARRARVVECRFFGGMSIEETARVLGISPATVSRDWALARVWLACELTGAASAGG